MIFGQKKRADLAEARVAHLEAVLGSLPRSIWDAVVNDWVEIDPHACRIDEDVRLSDLDPIDALKDLVRSSCKANQQLADRLAEATRGSAKPMRRVRAGDPYGWGPAPESTCTDDDTSARPYGDARLEDAAEMAEMLSLLGVSTPGLLGVEKEIARRKARHNWAPGAERDDT